MDAYDRLLETLAALWTDGEITAEQATGILLNWREIAGLETMIPLPAAAGIIEEDDDDGAAVLAILIAVLGARAAYARRPADVYRRLAPRYRQPVIGMIQDYHAEQAAKLADDLAAGRITLSQWQAVARRLNQTTIRTMAELGANGPLDNYAAAIRTIQLEQAAYLQRFTEQIAGARLAAAHPDLFPDGARSMTFEQIAARHAMYTGAGRALYFALAEESESGEAGGAGWVVLYHARDDDRTCSPCHQAEQGSPYLPGTGPMPGDVCLGGGACRCSREMIYDPAAYARLTGQDAEPAGAP